MFQNLQLYQAKLDIANMECDRLWQILSDDERSRADRYKREHLRRNFIAARGNLREILARSLNCEPQELNFGYSDRGKPFLKKPQNSDGLFFNLAHSQDLAIYALCSDREVGIDLEYINLQCDVERIAKRYFLPSEQKFISSFCDRQKYLAFYQIWTLKEAYGKATGQGIANILDVVDVAPLLISMEKNLQIEGWTLELLNSAIDLNYAAAICVSNSEL
jgi:4'-phosphopantetheinyl transferase